MALMDRLRQLVSGSEVPEETRALVAKARTPGELMRGLEELRGNNEMEMRHIEEELAAVERSLAVEEEKVRSGVLTAGVKTSVLRRIERLRKHVATLDDRLAIFHENVSLHQDLIFRIQQIEAMGMRGIGEDQIDHLIEQFDDSLKDYSRVRLAGRESEQRTTVDRSEEARRHEALERELLGGKAAPAKTQDRTRELE